MNLNLYLTYDLPIPYKTLKIYPVTVKDYLLFNVYSQCLVLDKNTIPDPKIISMTDLEYIYHATEEDLTNKPYIFWLDRLLAQVFKDDPSFEKIEESIKRYGYDEKGKPFFTVGDEKINSKSFMELKTIICEQNLIGLPDDMMSKEVRDSLEKAREYKRKLKSAKPVSLEDYIVSLSAATGWSLESIYSMTIRKFTKLIKRMDNLIHYQIYLSASVSGMVEFKDTSFIKHWLSNLDDDDKYSDVSVGLDEIQGKISLESAKK